MERVWIGRLCCALGMIGAGSVVPASKLAADGLPLFTAAAGRYAVAALVLVPWALRRHGMPRLDARDGLVLAAQGAAGSLGFAVLTLAGLRLTGGADAGVIAGSLPALVAALAALLPGGRMNRSGWIAAAAASLGAACLGLGGASGNGNGGQRLLGDLLLLGAMAGEAAFVLLNRALRVPLPPLTVSALMCLLGLAFTLPPALTEAVGAVPLAAGAAVLWHALVPTVAGFVLWYAGAARVSGAEAAAFCALMPVTAVLSSAAVLGEAVGPHHLLGVTLAAAGIVVPLIPRGCRR